MKFKLPILYLLTIAIIPNQSAASVYKCTDKQGKVAYQSSPCATEENALKIDMKTGQTIDLAVRLKQKQNELELKKQREVERLLQEVKEAKRIADSIEQSAINQQLIKNNPVQYTAFAIPPYRHDRLIELVKPFAARLPEIEKFRRLAAQKALGTGECIRVESDQLSIKSQIDQLMFTIDCSTAKSFLYNESELSE